MTPGGHDPASIPRRSPSCYHPGMKPLDSMHMPRPAGAADPIITVSGLTKTYASGYHALKGIDLEIRRGEIFALLGPNGAGKTSLISIICGIVNATSGTVTADGHDIVRDYRAARKAPPAAPIPAASRQNATSAAHRAG